MTLATIARRSSLNILQQRMVERLTPWAREVVIDSMARYTRQSTGRFTVAEYEKAAWVWNNRAA